MRSTYLCALLLVLGVGWTQAPMLGAQGAPMGGRGPRGPRGPGGPQGHGRGMRIERIMRMRDALELTDDQFRRFDELRQEVLERREERMGQMAELRSEVAAGLVEREEVREQVMSLRDGMRETAEQQREQVLDILTDEQKEQLQSARRGRYSGAGGFGPGGHRHDGGGYRGGFGLGGPSRSQFGMFHRDLAPGSFFSCWR